MRHPQARPRRWRLIAGSFAVLLVTGACSSDDTSSDPDDTTTTTAPGTVNALTHPERVPGIIREHFGGSPEIRRLNLGDDGFSVQVRDKVKRDNMDDYFFYDGAWRTSPVSVSMSEIEEYESVTFSLTDIDFAKVPDLMQQALDGLDLEGEEISSVSFDRLSGDTPRVYMGVNGTRGSGSLIANADGTEVEIRRS